MGTEGWHVDLSVDSLGPSGVGRRPTPPSHRVGCAVAVVWSESRPNSDQASEALPALASAQTHGWLIAGQTAPPGMYVPFVQTASDRPHGAHDLGDHALDPRLLWRRKPGHQRPRLRPKRGLRRADQPCLREPASVPEPSSGIAGRLACPPPARPPTRLPPRRPSRSGQPPSIRPNRGNTYASIAVFSIDSP